MTDRELMQQALEALEMWCKGPHDSATRRGKNTRSSVAIAALRERLAQPEQTVSMSEYKRLQELVTSQGVRLMEYESEQPEQEPVAWLYRDYYNTLKLAQTEPPPPLAFPVYTTPPRREWVGLTEAEKVNVAIACGCADVAWMDFADAIEAKLREKNA